MRRLFFCAAIAATVFISCTDVNTPPEHHTDGTFLNGSWTYRSLLNDTAWQTDFDSLEFAAAIMQLKTSGTDSINGLLYWQQNPTQGLSIKGTYSYSGDVTCFSLIGTGDSAMGTAEWQYNYQGYIVPKWKEGVNQTDALVGSVVRAKPHNGEPAGIVASIYMVRR